MFDAAEIRLRAAGYETVNPFCSDLNNPHYEGKDKITYEQYLRDDLKMLLECDAVAVLPEAEWSRGSRLEVDTAMHLAMPVLTVDRWLLNAGYGDHKNREVMVEAERKLRQLAVAL